MDSQYEREEDELVRLLNEGEITQKQFNEEMRDLHRRYRDAAEDAAREAYDREMDRW